MPPDVTHTLYENGILTDDDLDDLNNDNLPRQDRVKRLLDLLKGKSDETETLTQFQRSLEVKYKYLVKSEPCHGLQTFLECSCKDHNDNVKGMECVSTSPNHGNKSYQQTKSPTTSRRAKASESSWRPSTTDTSYNNKNLTAVSTGVYVACQSCLSNSCELHGVCLENNLSKPGTHTSRTSGESSWACNESNVYISQGLPSDTDNTAVPEILSPKMSVTSLNEHCTNGMLNAQKEKLVQIISKSIEGSPSQESLLSIEENDRVSGEMSAQNQWNHSESACENSWVDTGQSDISDDEDDREFTHTQFEASAHQVLKDISNIERDSKREKTTANIENIVKVDTFIEVAPGITMHTASGNFPPLFTLNGRPLLNRLTSSDSTCGVPIPLGFIPTSKREEAAHLHEKAKKKVKRKRYRHTSASHHHEGQYDDIDGDPKPAEAKHGKDEKSDITKESGEHEGQEAEEGAVGGEAGCKILQPVFKALPNNKKLMKRCSRLWDQLFFLREKGDWETFSAVTMKAFDKFSDCPDIQVLLYRSEMCVSTFYKNDQTKALEMFDKAVEQLPKTEMPNWHLARILPLKVELCTRSKMFEEASGLLEDAKQAMMSLGPCLSTGAVYFFEAIYLGNILQCTRNDTRSAEGITEQVKTCFLTAIEHYQQEETFAITSFLNQVYLFLALFSLGVDFKKIKYLREQDIKREDISLAEHYLNLFENNCWEKSTNWSRMLFYIGRGEQHKQMHNLERSLDYFKQAKDCSDSGKFGEHIAFIQNNIEVVTEKLEEQMRVQALKQNVSADDILKKVLESSSESGSSNDN